MTNEVDSSYVLIVDWMPAPAADVEVEEWLEAHGLTGVKRDLMRFDIARPNPPSNVALKRVFVPRGWVHNRQ